MINYNKSINSNNFDKKLRKLSQIKYIIVHYTGMQSEVEAIKRLLDPKFKVSCHFLVNKKGRIIKMVPERFISWHAGKSKWKKLKSLNKFSIGIELTNPGHSFGDKKFPKKQMLSLIKLLKFLIKKYKIPRSNILGHSDIAPLRKKDPGEKFPWESLSKINIGMWHNFNKNYLKKNRKIIISKKEKIAFFKFLKKIGYQTHFDCKKPFYEKKLIKAFQRRFRPELISGNIDKECLLISKNIAF